MRRAFAVLLLSAALVGCSASEPPAPLPGVPEASSSTTAAAEQARPVSVAVAEHGISGPVMLDGLGVDDNNGHVEPPLESPELASWYNLGPRPGELGPSVILGHVNGGGRDGIFADLDQVVEGDRVIVSREDGSEIAFEVYRTQTIDKDSFPAEEVYGNTDSAEIRLITCGGALDQTAEGGRYLSNIIVYARMVQILGS